MMSLRQIRDFSPFEVEMFMANACVFSQALAFSIECGTVIRQNCQNRYRTYTKYRVGLQNPEKLLDKFFTMVYDDCRNSKGAAVRRSLPQPDLFYKAL